MDLITGATGFIGRYLALRLIAEGRGVRVLCRPESTGKLDPVLLRRADIALVISGNAIRWNVPSTAWSGFFTARGMFRIGAVPPNSISSMFKAPAGFLKALYRTRYVASFISAPSRFSEFPLRPPSTIERPMRWVTSSSQTKIEGEKLVLRFHSETGLPVVMLRPSVVYGLRGTV